MFKKILLAVLGVFVFSSATFGAVVYTYDCVGCCEKVQMSEFNTLFGTDSVVGMCNVRESSSRYVTCEWSGSCGCLNCDVSSIGLGFMNLRTSYDDRIVYIQNPPSMFVRNYDYCLN
jgi:hypothetical protein